jgi:hypothetical protein
MSSAGKILNNLKGPKHDQVEGEFFYRSGDLGISKKIYFINDWGRYSPFCTFSEC